MGRSGAVGVLLKLGRSSVRADICKQQTVAICVTLKTKSGVKRPVSSCSGPEKCLDTGCTFALDMEAALEAVRSAAQMTLEEVFEVLESSVRGVARAAACA